MITKFTITRSDNKKYIVHVKGSLKLATKARVPKAEIHCFDSLQQVFELADKLFDND